MIYWSLLVKDSWTHMFWLLCSTGFTFFRFVPENVRGWCLYGLSTCLAKRASWFNQQDLWRQVWRQEGHGSQLFLDQPGGAPAPVASGGWGSWVWDIIWMARACWVVLILWLHQGGQLGSAERDQGAWSWSGGEHFWGELKLRCLHSNAKAEAKEERWTRKQGKEDAGLSAHAHCQARSASVKTPEQPEDRAQVFWDRAAGGACLATLGGEGGGGDQGGEARGSC